MSVLKREFSKSKKLGKIFCYMYFKIQANRVYRQFKSFQDQN